MVKFSKQFEYQLVPEWKEAFVDYWQLKKDLKKIHLLTNNNTTTNKQDCSFPNTLFSSLRSFSLFGHQHKEHGVIQVHKKLEFSASSGDVYETELLEQFADKDAANEFFACLDLQLNKVNQFYMTKENEFVERSEMLKKQMEILVELKSALERRLGKGSSSSSLESKEDDDFVSGSISFDEDSIRGKTEQEQGQDDELVRNGGQFTDSANSDGMEKSLSLEREDVKMRTLSGRVFHFQGKNLRIHIPLTNPSRTFSAITYLLWDDLINQSAKKCGQEGSSRLHINKTKLHQSEKMIRGAFIELYKGLGYLKTYRNLNMLAFVKILKKLDKVTNKQVSSIYLKVVESSNFNTSDKATKLADEVEEIFIKNLADDDRRKAMKHLKPTHRKESHAVTFFIGLSTGCFVALFVGYIIMARIAGMYRPQSGTVYMETVYPVLRQVSLCPYS
ncbi:Phosphate transporter PHO1 1 [Sarracenia purpurea var. burkii]